MRRWPLVIGRWLPHKQNLLVWGTQDPDVPHGLANRQWLTAKSYYGFFTAMRSSSAIFCWTSAVSGAFGVYFRYAFMLSSAPL